MLFIEADAKEIFRRHLIPIPDSVKVDPGMSMELPPFSGPWYLKAQIREGNRGLRGLVLRCDTETELVTADRLIHSRVGDVARLVEQAVPCVEERYLAIGIDATHFGPVLVMGDAGGVDVESSKTESAGWARIPIDVGRGLLPHDVIAGTRALQMEPEEIRSFVNVAMKLWDVFSESDTDLIEINPLGWEGSRHVALDAKLRTYDGLDDRRVIYFDRDGSVAVFSGGAGLGMAVSDMLTELGTPPANFVDVAGGVTDAAVRQMSTAVFKRTAMPQVRSLLMAMSASLTPLDGVLDVLVDVLAEVPPEAPTVAYFASGAAKSGTSVSFASLEAAGVEIVDSLEAAIRRASELAVAH